MRVRGLLPAEKAVKLFDVRLAMFDLVQKRHIVRIRQMMQQSCRRWDDFCNRQSMKVQTVNLSGGPLIYFQAVPAWLTKIPGTEETSTSIKTTGNY